MTRPEGKAAERDALAHLVANVDLGAAVEQIIERERPDFLLTFDNGETAGLEVVELVRPEMAAGMAGYKRRFMQLLLEALEQQSLEALVHTRTRGGFINRFNEGGVPEAHAAAVLDLVREHIASGRPRTTYVRDQLVALGAPWLVETTIEAGNGAGVVCSARTGRFHESFIQARVDAKGQKLDEYRANVNGPVWLLLVGGSQFAGGVWSQSNALRDLRSNFDRLFYVDAYDRAAFELASKP